MGNVFIYFSMIIHAIVAECSMGFPIIDGAFRNVNFYHLLPLVSVWLLIAMTGCLGSAWESKNTICTHARGMSGMVLCRHSGEFITIYLFRHWSEKIASFYISVEIQYCQTHKDIFYFKEQHITILDRTSMRNYNFPFTV